MGGGWNKTHGTVERHICLDSFFIGQMAEGDHDLRWGNGSEIATRKEPEALILAYKSGGEAVRDTIGLSFVGNGFGGNPRTYFHCPRCGERAQKLYLVEKHFQCRRCAQINYHSQQVTHGWAEEVWRMERVLQKDFRVNTRKLAPINMEE